MVKALYDRVVAGCNLDQAVYFAPHHSGLMRREICVHTRNVVYEKQEIPVTEVNISIAVQLTDMIRSGKLCQK